MPIYSENSKLLSSIKELKEELERKNREFDCIRSVFLSNVSHEIRTPMNAIVGFANLLADDDMSVEDKKEFIRHINDNSEMLLRLIDNMIDLTMLQSGKIKLENKSFSINSLIDELCSDYRNSETVRSKGLQIMTSAKRDNPAEAVSDPRRLKSAMQHLIDSAIRNTQEGFVKFGYFMEENSLHFFIRYTGCAFDLDEFQGDPVDAQDYTGSMNNSGLSVVIAKSIVEIMRGSVWSENGIKDHPALHFTIPFKKSTGLMNRFYKLGIKTRKNIAI